MSAPFLMGRTAILIVILAASLVAFASDAPTGAAHPHRKAVAARTHHGAQAAAVTHQTVNEQRRASATASSLSIATAHSSHRPAHSMPRVEVNETRARETQSTPHAPIAAERVSASHRNSAVAEEPHRVRERQTEREKPEAQPAARAAATADEAKSTAGEVKSIIDARRSATHEAATTQDSDPATDVVPSMDSTKAPALLDDDSRPRLEPTSLTIPRGVMPSPLRGSHESLQRQDERLQADGLERIENENDLASRIEHHLLVPVPASDALTVNAELPANHRYCRPWTARFLADLARAHEAAFHKPIEVSSAVRTVEYQQHLMRINGNAAPAEGDIFSPHLMGATIDIAKGQMTRDEIAWMRRHLLALQLAGKIDVEEEFEQACFHISVYKSYAPPRASRTPKARAGSTRRSTTPADTPDVAQTSGQ